MRTRIGTRLLLLILAASVLSGCAGKERQRVLEKLGVISGMGYDVAENGMLLGTALIPNFIETGSEQVDVLSAKGRTSKELRFNMSRLSERKLVSGQIRVVLYGQDLAKTGILTLSDTLFRDSEVGSQIHLAIVEKRAADFYLKRFPDKPSTDIYLYQMIRKEMEQNTIPESNLHRFLHDVYDTGKDPVLPYLRLGKEDAILDGLAVFREDRMVGRLSADESRLLAYMLGHTSTGEVEAELDERSPFSDHSHVVMMYLKFKHRIEVSQANGKPRFQVHLAAKGAVTEYTGFKDLEEPKNVEWMQRVISEELQKKSEAVLHKLQKEFQSDPIGFGELYRAAGYLKELKPDEWKKLYAQADIGADVNIEIVQTGMIH